jgi:hypothetical protein
MAACGASVVGTAGVIATQYASWSLLMKGQQLLAVGAWAPIAAKLALEVRKASGPVLALVKIGILGCNAAAATCATEAACGATPPGPFCGPDTAGSNWCLGGSLYNITQIIGGAALDSWAMYDDVFAAGVGANAK